MHEKRQGKRLSDTSQKRGKHIIQTTTNLLKLLYTATINAGYTITLGTVHTTHANPQGQKQETPTTVEKLKTKMKDKKKSCSVLVKRCAFL